MKYRCPLCNSPLSEDHYHKVIKIQEKKEKVQKGELDKLQKLAAAAQAKAVAARARERETKSRAKLAVRNAKKQGALAERGRSERLMKGQAAKIKKLQDKVSMLEKGTSPQEIGLADEHVLVRRLEKEFCDDTIRHTGKGGDVLHFVKFNGEDAGCIVYECKHYDRIAADHVQQTALAKKTRQADYGILVTTGTRKGFSGLDQESGVFIVAQAGVLTFAGKVLSRWQSSGLMPLLRKRPQNA